MFGRSKKEEGSGATVEHLSKSQEEKVNAKFESFRKKEYSEEDMHKVFDNEENIMGKMMDRHLSRFIDDVKLFFSMLRDFITRTYIDVPVGTIVAVASTLLYVLSPVDIIPDFIPVAGYLDDAGVMGLCLKFVKVDLDKYKQFKGISDS